MRSKRQRDFMQYEDEGPLTFEQEEALSGCGQFFSSVADFEFLARLRAGKVKRKERDKWFLSNERRQIYHMAQGILAAVYGEDPP